MFSGGRLATASQERVVTAARDAVVTALLLRGIDVVCDDTTLPQRHARALYQLAAQAGAGFEVWDLTDVPVEVCVERDAARTGPAHVGEQTIRELYQRYLAGRPYPLPRPDLQPASLPGLLPYVPPAGAPTAVMVDIDGTVALMHGRSPYDESRVGDDRPNPPVVAAVRAMHAAGHRVIFCSGRTEDCRDATERWLAEHVGVPYEALHMRAAGDIRKDAVVKAELFDTHIRAGYHVVAVFDDRRQVVEAWRALGLTVFQVAEGNF
jgi:hypothetical protein